MKTPIERLSADRRDESAPAMPPHIAIDVSGAGKSYPRGSEVFGQGERADSVYKVDRGAVCCFKTLADGRRQICDFALPGNLFGLEFGAEHSVGAEAVADSIIVEARRSTLFNDSSDSRAAANTMIALTMSDLERGRDHIVTLGRRSAAERVAAFLIDLAARLGARNAVELPMSRLDMADYLGLTIETVSRTIRLLESEGLIRLRGSRFIEFLDPPALEALCE